MLSLALLTPNTLAAEGIEQLTQASGRFKLVFKGSPEAPRARSKFDLLLRLGRLSG